MPSNRISTAAASRVAVAVFVVCALVAGAVMPVAASDCADGLGDATTGATATTATTFALDEPSEADDARNALAAGDETLDYDAEFALTPERRGEVTVTLRYDVPGPVVELETTVPANATVTDTDGFEADGGRTLVWDERTADPSVTYRFDVNESASGRVPVGQASTTDGLLFADVGPWALFRRPRLSTEWTSRGTRVSISGAMTTAGEGVVGDELVFLGPTTVHRRTAHGQRFRLAVPDAATLDSPPEAILDSLANASDSIRVGDRDDSVLVVAAPTDGVDWGVSGLQTGDSDAWVEADAPLDGADNVWIHEYVHTRQSYAATSETRWFTEASASYYAASLSLEQGRIGYGEYRSWLARGASAPETSTVLSRPSTWTALTPYRRGLLVAAATDRELREAGDGTLQDVLGAMNDAGGAVDGDAFAAFVADAGGGDARTTVEPWLSSTATPETWSLSTQVDAFGPFPAHFEYTFDAAETGDSTANATDPRVAGPYRNGTVDDSSGILLVQNETLTVPFAVENDGGRPGRYEGEVRVIPKSESSDRETTVAVGGRLDSGEESVETVSHAFERTGDYTLVVGDASRTVFVREPAEAAVVDVAVNRSTVADGGAVRLNATVRNPASRPGETTVAFAVDGETVATETVRLDAGGETTATTVVRLAAGTHRVGVDGGSAADVTVRAGTAGGGGAGSGDAGGASEHTSTTRAPGFGTVAACVAFVLFVGGVARREKRS